MLLVSEYNNMSVRTSDYFLSAIFNESSFSVFRIPEQIIMLICGIYGLLCTNKNIAEETVNNLRPLPSKPTHEESINCGKYGNCG